MPWQMPTFEEHAHLNSLALLNTDTLAVAYRGDGPAGNVRLYDIDLSTNGLTARGEAFVHDTANGAFNSLVSVNDETLALCIRRGSSICNSKH